MNTASVKTILLILLLSVSSPSQQKAIQPVQQSSNQPLEVAVAKDSTALDTFKRLRGRWAIYAQGKPLQTEVTYGSGSKDTIITEQFGKELSVIYPDGKSLLMTHFCNAGNHPRLRLKESSQRGLFEFEAFEVTNLTPGDTDHVQRIIYRIADARHMKLELVWKTDRGDVSEEYDLRRQ